MIRNKPKVVELRSTEDDQYEREEIHISPQLINDAFQKGIRLQGEKYLDRLRDTLSKDADFIGFMRNDDKEQFYRSFDFLKKNLEKANYSSPTARTLISIESFSAQGLRKQIVDKIGQLAFQLENISPSSVMRNEHETMEDSLESEIEEEEENEYEEDNDFEVVNGECKTVSTTYSSLDSYAGNNHLQAKKPFFSHDFGTIDKGITVEMKVSPSKPQQAVRKFRKNGDLRQSHDNEAELKSERMFQPRSPSSRVEAVISTSTKGDIDAIRRPHSMQAGQTTSKVSETNGTKEESYSDEDNLRRAVTAGDTGDVKKRNKIQKAWITNQQWKLGEMIGSGSFGDVFKVLNDKGRIYAAKRIRITDMDEADELLVEIQLMRGLSHQNIVEYLGAWVDEQECVIYVFQEWVPGGSVHQLLQKFGPLSLGVVKTYMRQILSGLEYLHNCGIIHRDIKGGNILVDEYGVVKLADFGASTKLSHLDKTQESVALKGTPFFMAPEVLAHNGKYGRKGDIWAVGCTMIQMLTGEPPWKDKNVKTHIQLYILLNSWEGPPEVKCEITPEARECLEMCFQKDEKLRPSATELLQFKFLKDDDLDDSNSTILDGSLSGSGSHNGLDDSGVIKGLKQAMNNAVNLSKLATPRRPDDFMANNHTPSPSKHKPGILNFQKLPPPNYSSPVAASTSVDVESTPRLVQYNNAYRDISPDKKPNRKPLAMIDSDVFGPSPLSSVDNAGKAPRDIILLRNNFPLPGGSSEVQATAKKNPFARGVISLKSNSSESQQQASNAPEVNFGSNSGPNSQQSSPGISVLEFRSPPKPEHSPSKVNGSIASAENATTPSIASVSLPPSTHAPPSPAAIYAAHYPHNMSTNGPPFVPGAVKSIAGNSPPPKNVRAGSLGSLGGIEEAEEESSPQKLSSRNKLGDESSNVIRENKNLVDEKEVSSTYKRNKESIHPSSSVVKKNNGQKTSNVRSKSPFNRSPPASNSNIAVEPPALVSVLAQAPSSAPSVGSKGGAKVSNNKVVGAMLRSGSSSSGVSLVGVSTQAHAQQGKAYHNNGATPTPASTVAVSSSVDTNRHQPATANNRGSQTHIGSVTVPKGQNSSHIHQLRAMQVNARKNSHSEGADG